MKEVAPGYYEFSEEIRLQWENSYFDMVEEVVLPNPEEFGVETVFLLKPLNFDEISISKFLKIDSQELKDATKEIDLVMFVVESKFVPKP